MKFEHGMCLGIGLVTGLLLSVLISVLVGEDTTTASVKPEVVHQEVVQAQPQITNLPNGMVITVNGAQITVTSNYQQDVQNPCDEEVVEEVEDEYEEIVPCDPSPKPAKKPAKSFKQLVGKNKSLPEVFDLTKEDSDSSLQE